MTFSALLQFNDAAACDRPHMLQRQSNTRFNDIGWTSDVHYSL